MSHFLGEILLSFLFLINGWLTIFKPFRYVIASHCSSYGNVTCDGSSEIMPSGWLKLIKWLVTSNQMISSEYSNYSPMMTSCWVKIITWLVTSKCFIFELCNQFTLKLWDCLKVPNQRPPLEVVLGNHFAIPNLDVWSSFSTL